MLVVIPRGTIGSEPYSQQGYQIPSDEVRQPVYGGRRRPGATQENSLRTLAWGKLLPLIFKVNFVAPEDITCIGPSILPILHVVPRGYQLVLHLRILMTMMMLEMRIHRGLGLKSQGQGLCICGDHRTRTEI